MGLMPELASFDVHGLKLLVPDGVVMQELDDEVSTAFQACLDALSNAGAEISIKPFDSVDRCVDMFLNRAIAGYEAYAHHKPILEKYGDEYDPYVGQRIAGFSAVTREEQAERYIEKATLRRDFEQAVADGGYDALVYPTVASVPPPIADAQVTENTGRINLRCLRNTASANYFDGCSLSLPCHRPGEAPVGFMLSSVHGDDNRLYQIAAGIELVLNDLRGVG